MKTRSLARGMTLIELMIALLISTILTIAIFLIMSTFESRRRTLGSGSDLDQSGSIAMFQVDQWVRGAGTGITQAVKRYADDTAQPFAYGCELFAAKSGAQILPRSTALPAPFDQVNPGATGVFRLAPVMILPGQTTPGASGSASDVLVTMASGSGNGQVPVLFDNLTPTTATQINLVNTVAFSASSAAGASTATSNLILLADQSGAGGTTVPCLVSQVSSTFSNPIDPGPPQKAVTALPLGGAGTSWYAATVGTQSVTSYPLNTGVAIDLGSPTSPRPPSFQVIGVGNNNTLYTYDLLNITSTPLQARAEGVFEMHALYGVGSTFYSAAASSTYSVAALSAGDSVAANLITGINAIRVGLILRTSLKEKDVVNGPTTLTLFADQPTGIKFTRTLSVDEQHYRYRTIEATIPLRNSF